MAIIKRNSFALLLAALLSASVSGQTNIMFDRCGRAEDRRNNEDANSFENDRQGSMRRTYGNLCSGTREAGSTDDDIDIDSRVGHPFRTLCDIIDNNPNVLALMNSGNSPHTIFAPTDAAFAKVSGLISRVDEQRLLELHILPQARLTRDLRCGQTYRTINTRQSRKDNQRSKTRCINAARSQQLGPGNIVNGLKPTIGIPDNIFRVDEFQAQRNFVVNVNQNENDNDADRETFSQDVISCNGVIHVVDEVLLPGNANAFRTHGEYSHGLPNYYGGHSHSHGQMGDGSYYYGGYYNRGHGHGYYGGYYGHHGRGHAHSVKGGKGGKGAKGFKGGARRYYNPYYSSVGPGFFRKLGEEEAAMSDAEFFGTDGMVENDATTSDGERKRKLEALLEPDGNIE